MKQITSYDIGNIAQKAKSSDDVVFTSEQVQLITYFFEKIKRIYGENSFDHHFKSEADIKAAKREYGNKIIRYNIEQIKRGFEYIKDQQIAGEQGYKYINLGSILHAVRECNKKHAAHIEYRPSNIIEDQGQIERNKQKGEQTLSELFKVMGAKRAIQN